jgi:PAS domain S-box-containing protein
MSHLIQKRTIIFLSIAIWASFVLVLVSLLLRIQATGTIIDLTAIILLSSTLILPFTASALLQLYHKKTRNFFLQYINELIDHESVIPPIEIGDQQIREVLEKISLNVQLCRRLNSEVTEKDIFRQGYFNTMINGLLVHDKMKIYEVNRSFCEMTGYSEEEIKSITLDRLIIPHESITGGLNETSSRLYYRSMCFPKSKGKFPVDIQMSWLKINHQHIQISIVRDLREKRKIEEELQSERARRTQAIFDGQEMERSRLAREIHDGLGQSLIAIRLLIEGKIAGASEVNKEALEKIRGLIDSTISDARLMSNNLMPSVLHEFGFVTALRQLCDHVRQSSKMNVKYDVECSKFMLSSVQTVYLFRIAQEAVNNILKHSKATEMGVLIFQTENELNLIISDNGKGIDTNKMNHNSGNGLFNIRERVQLLQGEFKFISESGKGTELQIKVPNWRLVNHE